MTESSWASTPSEDAATSHGSTYAPTPSPGTYVAGQKVELNEKLEPKGIGSGKLESVSTTAKPQQRTTRANEWQEWMGLVGFVIVGAIGAVLTVGAVQVLSDVFNWGEETCNDAEPYCIGLEGD